MKVSNSKRVCHFKYKLYLRTGNYESRNIHLTPDGSNLTSLMNVDPCRKYLTIGS